MVDQDKRIVRCREILKDVNYPGISIISDDILKTMFFGYGDPRLELVKWAFIEMFPDQQFSDDKLEEELMEFAVKLGFCMNRDKEVLVLGKGKSVTVDKQMRFWNLLFDSVKEFILSKSHSSIKKSADIGSVNSDAFEFYNSADFGSAKSAAFESDNSAAMFLKSLVTSGMLEGSDKSSENLVSTVNKMLYVRFDALELTSSVDAERYHPDKDASFKTLKPKMDAVFLLTANKCFTGCMNSLMKYFTASKKINICPELLNLEALKISKQGRVDKLVEERKENLEQLQQSVETSKQFQANIQERNEHVQNLVQQTAQVLAWLPKLEQISLPKPVDKDTWKLKTLSHALVNAADTNSGLKKILHDEEMVSNLSEEQFFLYE